MNDWFRRIAAKIATTTRTFTEKVVRGSQNLAGVVSVTGALIIFFSWLVGNTFKESASATASRIADARKYATLRSDLERSHSELLSIKSKVQFLEHLAHEPSSADDPRLRDERRMFDSLDNQRDEFNRFQANSANNALLAKVRSQKTKCVRVLEETAETAIETSRHLSHVREESIHSLFPIS